MVDENPYRSPSATREATPAGAHQPPFMSRFERLLVLFDLVCVAVYTPCFLVFVPRFEQSPAVLPDVRIFITVHFSVSLLHLAVLILIIRDLWLRKCFTASYKLMWGVLFFLLWPSMYLYFFMYAWKPRTISSE